MKMTSQVWLRVTNVGKPADRLDEGPLSLRDALSRVIGFMQASYMGSRIEIQLARNPADFASTQRGATRRQEELAEFDRLMDSMGIDLTGADDEED